MESYIKLQNDIFNNISRGLINLKKSSKGRITESYIEARLENLEKLWNMSNEYHAKIVTLAADDKTYDYFTDGFYEKTEETYLDYKAELTSYLKKLINVPQNSNSNPGSDSSSKFESSNIKLPKITLPTFSGSYNEWVSFRDLFLSLIHNNSSLDDVQKLHYLKSHLTGEAEQLLRHVPITAQNYQVCWSQLEKRFNNKRYLSNCILKRFMSQRNITSESSSAIKELLDTSNECLNALNNLGIETQSWDIMVIHILCLKLDSETRKLWEVKLSELNDELPNLSKFNEFLESRFRSLEFLLNKPNPNCKLKPQVKTLHITNPVSCIFCKENHKLSNCKKFCKEDVDERRNFVQTNRLCFNCMAPFHSASSCRQSTRCQVARCHKRHHSLLHPRGTEPGEGVHRPSQALGQSSNIVHQHAQALGQGSIIEPKQGIANETGTHNIVTCFSNISSQVLLATALVKAEVRTGYSITVRALLDQGSQASFITEATVQLMGLKKIYTNSNVFGLGDDHHRSVVSKAVVSLKLQSLRDPSFSITIKAHVLKKLTSFLPETKVKIQAWKELEKIELADPLFHTPNKIDILLGADVYGQILLDGILKGPAGYPVAQNTKLGWVISGQVETNVDNYSLKCCASIISLHVHSEINENELLRKFWELEAEPKENKIFLTEEEQKCEEMFSKTTKRDESGRYIVKLPFKSDDPLCKYGNSKSIALRRFLMLEKRLEKDKPLQKEYSKVIQEYLDLGHMEIVPDADEDKPGAVYLPHHAVVKEEKDTTKVRVVYDASCAGINGASLNTDLMIGPTLQSDLRTLLMRWRLYPVCLVADIEKMYRQVKVSREDVDFQRILWRDPMNPESEIKSYRLLTVTFGTAAAPYLAVKVLQQTALDEGKDSPAAAEKIKSEFYMDDLLSGCQSVDEGKKLHKAMNEILKRGGFLLRKWSSNSEELLSEIQEEGKTSEGNLEIKTDKILKILGLTWNRNSDEFEYVVNLPQLKYPVTKRNVISDIARLFDPLGWIAPMIIKAKIFIQQLWISGIDWDEELPPNLLNLWISFRDELNQLVRFRLPRWLNTTTEDKLELHGFCDASNHAYAAVVYLRASDKFGKVHVNLVSSKTKVAPIKQVTIPRLELCGAVLLSKLLQEVSNTLRIKKENIFAWTDSSVVLAWLSSHPSRWKPFVANRVSEILSVLDSSQWSHVQSKDNPADCASRGANPEQINVQLWTNGPNWLRDEEVCNFKEKNLYNTNLEEKKVNRINTFNTLSQDTKDDSFLSKYSSLTKLIRIIAYCRRFLRLRNINKEHKPKPTIWLTNKELEEARNVCIKHYQNLHFHEEIKNLKETGKVNKKSALTLFNPFLDSADIVRVGGRLERSSLTEGMKHPVTIPRRSHMTNLLIADAHSKTLHGGPQLMLNYLRSQYWVLDAKNQVKWFVRKCVVCLRYSSKGSQQLMGQLPPARSNFSRPFLHSGVDYAGPISIRTTKGRGHHAYKGYVCLFVCMSTRAIHLEAVSDLTAQGFLAGFKRFVSRRGHCAHLWSDNATNFVGSSRELKRLFNSEKSSMIADVADWLASNHTEWHFIPPHTPNFGGLWEAGIRSTKFHLKRVIGSSTLTFEEITTVLAQIEACLNSRPISQLSQHPGDPCPLTPGHFLVGEPLVLIPELNYETSNISSLNRWQLTQKMTQEFWRRWSNEYLTRFLHRYKWAYQNPEPKLGDLVLVKEDDLPPAKWLYGIIIQKHPGLDNINRVVSIKCKGSIFKRPVSKLCILPVTD